MVCFCFYLTRPWLEEYIVITAYVYQTRSRGLFPNQMSPNESFMGSNGPSTAIPSWYLSYITCVAIRALSFLLKMNKGNRYCYQVWPDTSYCPNDNVIKSAHPGIYPNDDVTTSFHPGRWPNDGVTTSSHPCVIMMMSLHPLTHVSSWWYHYIHSLRYMS